MITQYLCVGREMSGTVNERPGKRDAELPPGDPLLAINVNKMYANSPAGSCFTNAIQPPFNDNWHMNWLTERSGPCDAPSTSKGSPPFALLPISVEQRSEAEKSQSSWSLYIPCHRVTSHDSETWVDESAPRTGVRRLAVGTAGHRFTGALTGTAQETRGLWLQT